MNRSQFYLTLGLVNRLITKYYFVFLGVRGKPEGAIPLQVTDVQHVGEPDGQSFGVGVAPSSAKAQIVAVPSNFSKRVSQSNSG